MRLISVFVAMLGALCLVVACGPVTPKTEVHGGQVVQGNSFASTDTGASHKAHTSVTITPGVSAAAVTHAIAATQPTSVAVDGETLTAPPGTTITYTNDVENHDIPATVSEENHATATGASISTNGDKGNVTGDPPKVDINAVTVTGLNGSGAKGGGGKSSAGGFSFDFLAVVESITPASARGEMALWWVGIIFLVGGLLYPIIERLLGGSPDWQLVIGAQYIGPIVQTKGSVAKITHPEHGDHEYRGDICLATVFQRVQDAEEREERQRD